MKQYHRLEARLVKKHIHVHVVIMLTFFLYRWKLHQLHHLLRSMYNHHHHLLLLINSRRPLKQGNLSFPRRLLLKGVDSNLFVGESNTDLNEYLIVFAWNADKKNSCKSAFRGKGFLSSFLVMIWIDLSESECFFFCVF